MDLCPAQASSLGLFFSSPEFNFSACIKWPTGWPPSIYTLADAWQALISFYRVRKRDLSPLVCAHPWYFSFRPKRPAPATSTHASHVGFKSRHIWFWLLISIIWVEFLYVKAGSSNRVYFNYLSPIKYLVRAWTVSEQIVGEGAITTRG